MENNDQNNFTNEVKVWRLHPHGVKLTPADIRLGGEIPADALKYCGPFTNANQAGFYIHSPVDIDVCYDPNTAERWSYELLSDYPDDDAQIILEMMPQEAVKTFLAGGIFYGPRRKLRFSPVEQQPGPNVLMIWTGCIFQTPPGWGMWLRSPINREYDTAFRVEEGILETDWLPYDVWLNLRFHRYGEVAHIRRDGPPLAQIVPVPRRVFEPRWSLQDQMVTEGGEEGQAAFNRWLAYNQKKYGTTERPKDSSTYHRERKREKRERGEQW